MTPFCAAIDWGTSNFRLWVLSADGAVLAKRESNEGLQHSISAGFESVMESHLAALNAPKELPVIICGMAGSRQGWKEAPYVDTPAKFTELISNSATIAHTGREVRILPGVAQRNTNYPDVIRGEETQLLGIVDTMPQTGFVCMPGTHSKWVRMENGELTGFSTYLTGELFGLLADYSILKLGIEDTREFSANDPAFLNAVEASVSRPQEFSNRLFSIRSSGLLGFATQHQGAAGLSGNMIGLEIAGARSRYNNITEVTLIASGQLAALYESALTACGIETNLRDADEAVINGLFQAACNLWPVQDGRIFREA